jgi:hypothetical protein
MLFCIFCSFSAVADVFKQFSAKCKHDGQTFHRKFEIFSRHLLGKMVIQMLILMPGGRRLLL